MEISFARINSYGIFLAIYEFSKMMSIDIKKEQLVSQEINVLCEYKNVYYGYGENQKIVEVDIKKSGSSGF